MKVSHLNTLQMWQRVTLLYAAADTLEALTVYSKKQSH
jgi:hypothetical protein